MDNHPVFFMLLNILHFIIYLIPFNDDFLMLNNDTLSRISKFQIYENNKFLLPTYWEINNGN